MEEEFSRLNYSLVERIWATKDNDGFYTVHMKMTSGEIIDDDFPLKEEQCKKAIELVINSWP
jgi:hypothetical protein